jgi:hypothetical protein
VIGSGGGIDAWTCASISAAEGRGTSESDCADATSTAPKNTIGITIHRFMHLSVCPVRTTTVGTPATSTVDPFDRPASHLAERAMTAQRTEREVANVAN